MPQDNLYPSILNLDQYDIFLEEKLNDSNYIEIDKLPNTLGYGKHYFLLSWKINKNNSYQIKDGSQLLYEFKDSDGNIIFSDSTNTLPINGSAVCYTWIKKNPLRLFGDRWEIKDGPCTLSVVYRLSGGNIRHNDTVYGRSTFQYQIVKKNPNTSPILFHSGSELSGGLSISESLDFDNDSVSPYKRSILHISNSNMKTDGGKVEFIELSYIESSSVASSSAFKTLTTYRLSGSGEYFEVTSSDADGLNPLSHIHRVVTPREIRRNKNVTFKLRFLNANKEITKDISENSDISLTYSMAVTGSPFILETNDNLIHSSGSLSFGDSIEKSIRMSYTKDDKESPRLSFKEFDGNSFVKEVGRIDAGMEQYTFGTLASNTIDEFSSGSSIIGNSNNNISISSGSSIVTSFSSSISQSNNSAIFGGNSGSISGSDDAVIIGGSGSLIDNMPFGTIIGGKSNEVHGDNTITEQYVGFNSIIGGSLNVIKKSSISYGNLIAGGQGGSISFGGAQCTSGIVIGGVSGRVYGGSNNFVIGGDTNRVYATDILNPVHSGIIGGSQCEIESNHSNTVIIGMTNKTSDASDTVYVDNLKADGNLIVSGNISTSGSVTAREFHTEFVSSSITYSSGSTQFGDTADDTHTFTGHITASGNISASGNILTSGEIYQGNLQISGASDMFHFRDKTNPDDPLMTLDGGNIRMGIGSELPTKALQVTGDISASSDFYQPAGKGTIYGHETNFDYRVFASANGGFIVRSGSAFDPLRISASGATARVNIGTSDNSGKELTVQGSISASGNFYGKQYTSYFANFQDDLGTTIHYIPIGTNNYEMTSGDNDEVGFVAPFDGEIVKIMWRQNYDASGTTQRFGLGVVPSGTDLTSVDTSGKFRATVTGMATDTVGTVTVADVDSASTDEMTFSKGETLFVYMRNASDVTSVSAEHHVTVVFLFDTAT